MKAGWLHVRYLSVGVMMLLAGSLCGCGTSGPARDDLFATQMERGGQAFKKDNPVAARQHFEQAFQRALAIDQPLDAADAGYNAALCSARVGQYEQAGMLLSSSMNIRRMAGLDVPWDMLLLQAKILAQQQNSNAEATARQALAVADTPGDRNACMLFIARLQLAGARVDEAEKMIALIDAKSLEPARQGEYAALNGAVLRVKGEPAEAAQAYVNAVNVQRDSGLYEEMADSMCHAAECFDNAAESDQAVSWYLQCAAVAYGQQRELFALNAIKQAMAILEKTENAQQVRQAESLLKLIRQKVD